MKEPYILLFDFDGVLITQYALEYTALLLSKNEWFEWQNTEDLRLIDYAKLFEQSDGKASKNAFIRLYKTYKPYLPKRFKRIIYFSKFRRYYRKFEKIYEKLKANVESTLHLLQKKGALLAIVSNTGQERLDYFAQKFELHRFFSVFTCRDSVSHIKPSPYPILHTLVQLKRKHHLISISKENVFFIGDLPSDIESGNKAGVNSVALLSGHGTYDELSKAKPKYIIQKFKDLLEIEPLKKLLLE